MRPRLITAENGRGAGARVPRPAASMRPRLITAENPQAAVAAACASLLQ